MQADEISRKAPADREGEKVALEARSLLRRMARDRVPVGIAS